MGGRIAIGVVGALSLSLGLVPLAAGATPTWQAPITADLVRGAADPVVAIDEAGKAALAYSTNENDLTGDPWTMLLMRAPGSPFIERGLSAASEKPALAVNAAGAMVVAGPDAESGIEVYISPAPGPPASQAWNPLGRAARIQTIYVPQRVAAAIDGAGRATIVWTTPGHVAPGDPPMDIYTATVDPGGVVSPVTKLLTGSYCGKPTVESNERGDTVVFGNCAEIDDDVFVRPAGGELGPGEGSAPFAGRQPPDGITDVTLAGDGSVIAYATWNQVVPVKGAGPDYRTEYAVRGAGGEWQGARVLAGPTPADRLADLEAQEDGRALAVWLTTGGVGYAIRPAGGEFGPAKAIRRKSSKLGARGLSVAVAPRGPAVVSWRELLAADDPFAPDQRVAAAIVRADGTATAGQAVGLVGRLPTSHQPLSFAINARGLAIGAWEQQCGPGRQFAVMTVVFDERRGTTDPPCQDTAAPKVAVRPQRARLVGRKLRVRIGCDEACRIVVRARVLRGGKGRPLATAKTRRGTSIGARRYRTFALRLTARQAAKVRAGVAARRRISVRLALSVRDGFDNGAVRRVAVPLHRSPGIDGGV
jgi:hypothetical protein